MALSQIQCGHVVPAYRMTDVPERESSFKFRIHLSITCVGKYVNTHAAVKGELMNTSDCILLTVTFDMSNISCLLSLERVAQCNS